MRVRVVIRGRVQMVGFRDFAAREAYRLGVSGWVRNTEEGEVEAAAEGGREELEELVSCLRRGPRGARVSGVEVEWSEGREEFRGFRIVW